MVQEQLEKHVISPDEMAIMIELSDPSHFAEITQRVWTNLILSIACLSTNQMDQDGVIYFLTPLNVSGKLDSLEGKLACLNVVLSFLVGFHQWSSRIIKEIGLDTVSDHVWRIIEDGKDEILIYQALRILSIVAL